MLKNSGKQLLKKYKVKSLFSIKFDIVPVYGDNDKYIKTKKYIIVVWIHISQGKKTPKEKGACNCLSIIMLDSVIKVKKNYYPQILLGQRKYEPKKIIMKNLIDHDLEKSSSDVSGSESDNDSNNEIKSDDEKDNDVCNE